MFPIFCETARMVQSLERYAARGGHENLRHKRQSERPGAVELPIGTRLSEIIDEHCGGMAPGSQFKACLPGGASTRFMTA